MYNEDSFNNYIFWIKVKRIFFMLIFSIVGAILGFFISDYIINVLFFSSIYRIIIISASTLLFFSISLLITANTGKEVQDGYWKIAVLRKLTVISKKLDSIEKLDNLSSFNDNHNIEKNTNDTNKENNNIDKKQTVTLNKEENLNNEKKVDDNSISETNS